MTFKQIVTASIIAILLLVTIGQNIVLYLSLRNVYADLSGQTAAIKFEVKDLRAVAVQELTATRRAAEMTRADSASQEAYTQKRIKALSDYVQKQRQLEIKQTNAISDTLAGFSDQLSQFDDQLYRLDKQAKERQQAAADSEESAYKMAYIVCLWATEDRSTANQAQAGCREMIKKFKADDLHEQPAPGWQWPLVGVGELAG